MVRLAIATLFESAHCIYPSRIHRLHVRRATCVEIAAFLDKREWIPCPIFPSCLDYIEWPSSKRALALLELPGSSVTRPPSLGWSGTEKRTISPSA